MHPNHTDVRVAWTQECSVGRGEGDAGKKSFVFVSEYTSSGPACVCIRRFTWRFVLCLCGMLCGVTLLLGCVVPVQSPYLVAVGRQRQPLRWQPQDCPPHCRQSHPHLCPGGAPVRELEAHCAAVPPLPQQELHGPMTDRLPPPQERVPRIQGQDSPLQGAGTHWT